MPLKKYIFQELGRRDERTQTKIDSEKYLYTPRWSRKHFISQNV